MNDDVHYLVTAEEIKIIIEQVLNAEYAHAMEINYVLVITVDGVPVNAFKAVGT